MPLIKQINPVFVTVYAGGREGALAVSHILDMERLYPGRVKLRGVVVDALHDDERQGYAAGIAEESFVPVCRDTQDAATAARLFEEWTPKVVYSVGYALPLPALAHDYPAMGSFAITGNENQHTLYENYEADIQGNALARSAAQDVGLLVTAHLGKLIGLPAEDTINWLTGTENQRRAG